jgi:hypothetical protein
LTMRMRNDVGTRSFATMPWVVAKAISGPRTPHVHSFLQWLQKLHEKLHEIPWWRHGRVVVDEFLTPRAMQSSSTTTAVRCLRMEPLLSTFRKKQRPTTGSRRGARWVSDVFSSPQRTFWTETSSCAYEMKANEASNRIVPKRFP